MPTTASPYRVVRYALDRLTLDFDLTKKERHEEVQKRCFARSRDSERIEGRRVNGFMASATSVSFLLDQSSVLQVYLRGKMVMWRILEDYLPDLRPLCPSPAPYITDYSPHELGQVLWDGQQSLNEIVGQQLLFVSDSMIYTMVDFIDHPPLYFTSARVIGTGETLLVYEEGDDPKVQIRNHLQRMKESPEDPSEKLP